jgi:predicted PurR-regulated permease PerM
MMGIDLRAARVIWTLSLFMLVAFIAYQVRGVLVSFALALFLAVLLSPLVQLVERWTPQRWPRSLALAIVYVALIAIVAAIVILLGSAIANDARRLMSRLPDALKGDPLSRLPLPAWLEPMREGISAELHGRLQELSQNAVPILTKGLERLAGSLTLAVSAVIIPIVAFFFIKDASHLANGLIQFLPRERRMVAKEILSDLRLMLAQYLRALLVLAALTFAAYSLFLVLTGAPYAVLLGGLASVLEFIPALGPLIAAVSILAVGAISGYPHWAWLLLFFIVYRLMQDYVLQPALMSSQVRVHPLLVIFGALAGAELAGVPGVFFSVPLIAAARAIFLRIWGEKRA